MLGRAVRLLALLSLVTPCASASAHGPPPTAYALVSSDDEGARVIRLSTGLALRRGPERFQFVCPAAWGDETAAPLAALEDGTVVVAAVNGLMLMDQDGALHAHPAPSALGTSTELVRTAHGVFSLRITQEGSELLAVDANSVRVLWKDFRSWYSLGARDDVLVLLRSSNSTLEQLTLKAADGAEVERQLATLAAPIDYVFARATRGVTYVLTLTQNAPVLGVLSANAFTKVAQGASTIAGPLRVGEDTLLAVDGQLSRLFNGAPSALAQSDYPLCLEESGGLAYACTQEGISRLDGAALAEPLFQMSWLVPPDLSRLPVGEARNRCDYQWQDMRFDLLALGMPLREDSAPDGGIAVTDAAVDAGLAVEPPDEQDAEGEGEDDLDAKAGPAAAGPGSKRGGDCSVLTLAARSDEHVYVLALVLVLVLVNRARARRVRPT